MTRFKSGTSLPPDAQVAWIAARRHGVVGYAELIEAGVTPDGVDRRVAAGWLHREYRGVFAVGHPGLTPRGRWAAAVLSAGERAALSNRSAGALWGICRDGAEVSVTTDGRDRRGAAGVETHAGRLRPGDTAIIDGIRVTKVARTLLDLAEVLTVEQLVAAIDQATANRQLHASLMSSVIKASRGRRGLKPLRAALLRTRPQDVLTRSELERRARRLVATAGLPAPEMNVRVDGYEVDMLWRDAGLVVELDGSEYHDPERDTRKTNNLMARGWTVQRFTWRQVVNDPAWVVQSLQAVRSRAACPGSPSSSA
jgi:very-short-patch-repair endonuclease